MRLPAVILEFLLCVSLVHAGIANALSGASCGNDMRPQASASRTAHTEPVMSIAQHHHHQHAVGAKAGGLDAGDPIDCKCRVKCPCVNLCAASTSGLVPTVSLLGERVDAISDPLVTPNDSFIRTPLLTDVFRPPSSAQL